MNIFKGIYILTIIHGEDQFVVFMLAEQYVFLSVVNFFTKNRKNKEEKG